MFIRFLFYNEICFNCREFRRKEDIYSTWFYAGSAFIKKYWTDEESIEIHLLNQLVCLLPNFSFTLFFITESFFRITLKCSSFSFYQIDSLWLFIDFLWHSFLYQIGLLWLVLRWSKFYFFSSGIFWISRNCNFQFLFNFPCHNNILIHIILIKLFTEYNSI